MSLCPAPTPASTTPTDTEPAVPACCRLAAHYPGAPGRTHPHPSDLSDAEWALIEPQLPTAAWENGRGGRPEKHCRRAICDAIFYLVDNGIKWRALPADFPPWPTVYAFFARWARTGVDRQLMAFLRREVRTRAGTPTS